VVDDEIEEEELDDEMVDCEMVDCEMKVALSTNDLLNKSRQNVSSLNSILYIEICDII